MKKYLPIIYVAITAIFIGVCVGLLIANETGQTTIILARQWQEKYTITETILPETAGLININTASAEDLCAIPGIGKGTAEKIIAHRQEHGAFIVPEDLLNVQGIGEAKFNIIKDYITVDAGE